MLNQRSDKIELLRIAEAVALEKSIDKEIILTSMESAIQKAAKTRFGSENDIRVIIDRESGDISLHKVLKVVENPENFDTEISLEQAIKINKKEDTKIGDEIFEKLPPVDFGRIAAQTARQVIVQSVRAAEKERQAAAAQRRMNDNYETGYVPPNRYTTKDVNNSFSARRDIRNIFA